MPIRIESLPNVTRTISQPRFDAYLSYCDDDWEKALLLYQWNIQISAAFLLPLHFFEISARNAVSEVLERVYTPQWPWDSSFYCSLPGGQGSPRSNLRSTRREQSTTGQVIANLKLFFWEKMFTSRHDTRLWKDNIMFAFPNAESGLSYQQVRSEIYAKISSVRRLRNRIAHHEPIFQRDLLEDYNNILNLIEWRDDVVANWVEELQSVTKLLQEMP